MATTPQPVLRGLATGTPITVPLVRPPKQGKDETPEDFEARKKRSARYEAVRLTVRRIDHKTARRLVQELDRRESRVRALLEPNETEKRFGALVDLEAAQEEVLALHREMLLQPVTSWGGAELGTALVKVVGVEVEFPTGEVGKSEEQTPEEAVRWLEQLDLLELAGGAFLLAQEPTRELGN